MTIRNEKHERFVRVIDLLEKEIWPAVAPRVLGRPITKRERERILGYGQRGV